MRPKEAPNLRWGIRVAATAAFAVAVSLLGAAGPASAHTELVASTPAEGAALATPPTRIDLQFNEPINPEFVSAALTIDGVSAGAQRVSRGSDDARITVALEGRDPTTDGPSQWRVDYRVSSGDGHPVTGAVTFTVRGPAPSAAPSSAPSSTPDSTGGSDAGETTGSSDDSSGAGGPSTKRSGGMPGWAVAILVLGGMALLLVGVLAATRLAGRSPRDGDAT